jgi:hypothetical protein
VLMLYGPAIHEAIAKGDLEELRSLQGQAEEQLKETGNLAAALEVLNAEVAKLEAQGNAS